LILSDIAKVLYAPRKAFKQIVENPKYLGVVLILLLFLAVQVAFEYAQFSKVNFEDTSPSAGELNGWTVNSTRWTTSSVMSNSTDFTNQTIYATGIGFVSLGNSSLQFYASNSTNMSATLSNINIDCGPEGFQNLSLRMKLVEPQSEPQQVTLTLYSKVDADYFTRDLTPNFMGASLTVWNNLTIPVGVNAPLWTSHGGASWSNITALKLDVAFPASSNITIRVDNLFFRGLYTNPVESAGANIAFNLLYTFFMQFVFEWLILTAIIYIVIRALKGKATWKPLFVAVGFAMFLLVFRGLIGLAATLALPPAYYPFELAFGVSISPFGVVNYPSLAVPVLSPDAQLAYHSVDSLTSVFQSITSFVSIAIYVWLGVLCTIAVGMLVPEFSTAKRAIASVVGLVVTIVLLLFFLVGII